MAWPRTTSRPDVGTSDAPGTAAAVPVAWPRVGAVVVVAGAVAVLATAVALLVRFPDLGAGELVGVSVVTLPAIALGLVIAWRRPHARVAPLLCLAGTVPLLVVGLGDLVMGAVARHPGAVPGAVALTGLDAGSWMLLYVPAGYLLLLFPDGRLPGPRWRVVAAGLAVVPAAFLVIGARDPASYVTVAAPVGPAPDWLFPLAIALLPLFLALLIAAATAMVVRYRRATDPVVRAQVRWFALAAGFLPLTLLLCWASYLLFDVPDLVVVGLALTLLALPAATTIALLRHDLYDVDRAVSAAATYAVVTAVLVAVFTAVTVGAGVLVGRDSAVVAAVATATAALVLAPLRTRVQRSVDRRLYPLRQSVRTTLTQLRARIDDGRARPEDLEATLRRALRDPALRLGYLVPGRPGVVDLTCAPLPLDPDVDPARQVPVRIGDTAVGVLLPVATLASRELLREVAADCALIVEVIRSRLELTDALREVADSRARLLHAGYRERRRLERDLHDGAQQRLVSLGMAIRLAQRHLDDGRGDGGAGAVDVNGLLDQAVAELGTAVAELRAIAHGLRPLDLDSGLAPAIRALTTALPISVALDLDDLDDPRRPYPGDGPDDVPDDVATTAYYVASEALANVVKHAGAESVAVSVARRDGHVHLRIRDDGRGGARARPGSGLAGLVDRVAAAGGELTVAAPVGRGTTIEAVLPCAR